MPRGEKKTRVVELSADNFRFSRHIPREDELVEIVNYRGRKAVKWGLLFFPVKDPSIDVGQKVKISIRGVVTKREEVGVE